jgi:hypothetical protein
MVHCDSEQPWPTAEQTSKVDGSMHSKGSLDGEVEVIEESAIERTASQALKKLKIDEILARVGEMREPIEEWGSVHGQLRGGRFLGRARLRATL